MNVLLLGNGFDIEHKLPTSYLSFLRTIKHIVNLDSVTEGITSGSIMAKVAPNDFRINECYKEYSNILNEFEISVDELTFVHDKKDNCWLKFFLLSPVLDTNDEEYHGWIDLERDIRYVLEIIKRCLINETHQPDTKYFEYLSVFKDIYFDSKMQLKDEFKVIFPYGTKIKIVNEKMIEDKLFEEFQVFVKILKFYFENFVEVIISGIKNYDEIGIKDYWLYVNNNKIITFNYTDTFEKFFKRDCQDSVFHIHGSLLEDNIILGTNPNEDDEKCDSNIPFIKFKKYYQRFMKKTILDYIDLFNDMKVNGYIDLLIMGHSLSISDKDVLVDLFDISNSITILFHDISSLNDMVANLIGVVGKTEYDRLRKEKKLIFKGQNTDLNQIISERNRAIFS